MCAALLGNGIFFETSKAVAARNRDGVKPYPIQRWIRLIASISGTENASRPQSQPQRGFGGMKR